MASDKYKAGPNASMYDSWTYEGAYANWYDEENKPLTKKCECGVHITMGLDVDKSFHSDWCPIKNEKV